MIYMGMLGSVKNVSIMGYVQIAKEVGTYQYQNIKDYLIGMSEKLSTEEEKKIYGIRQITSEPVFGNLSPNLGFREFILRGKEKVRGEFSLMCTAHNLLKIAKFVRSSGKSLGGLLRDREVLYQSVFKNIASLTSSSASSTY